MEKSWNNKRKNRSHFETAFQSPDQQCPQQTVPFLGPDSGPVLGPDLGPNVSPRLEKIPAQMRPGLSAGLTRHVSSMDIQHASPSFPTPAKAAHPLSCPHTVRGTLTLGRCFHTRGRVQPTGPHVTSGGCDSTCLVVILDPLHQLPLVHKLDSRMQWSCCTFCRSPFQDQQSIRAPCDESIRHSSLHVLATAVSEPHKLLQCTVASIRQQIHCQGVLPHGVCISDI